MITREEIIQKSKNIIGVDFQAIIISMLDTDLYKFTMQQTVYHQFPNAELVEFHFKCRTNGIDLVRYITEINRQIDWLCTLTFQEEEVNYLRSRKYIKSDYADFLTLFRLQRKYVNVIALNDTEIDVIIKGPWLHTILFEVPILAIINELYFRETQNTALFNEGENRLDHKIDLVLNANEPDFKFSDFGTRRRFSFEWQENVIKKLINKLPNNFTGTSNVYFAMKYNLVPIGTMAHEYLQACQALGPRLRDSQKFAFEKWVQEYRGDLGIALTDVVGVDAFIKDFDLYFCKLFDGVRHDSGNPYEWADKMLNHYNNMKIDARTKSFVFSDSLTFEKSLQLYYTYKDRVKTFFGIGTNLTNDLGLVPLNIVIKMTECNGSPVAKISDTEGKTMCHNESFLNYLKEVFNIH
jgi:nicotinate phosphoribosyltransferase